MRTFIKNISFWRIFGETESVARLESQIQSLATELQAQRNGFAKLLELYNEISETLCNVSKCVGSNTIGEEQNTNFQQRNIIGFNPTSLKK